LLGTKEKGRKEQKSESQ